jgi:hypothetical protein
MPIPIHQEEEDVNFPQEKCCFCREATPWWSAIPDRKPGEQVAICPHCASRCGPVDVPTKKEWCRREDIAKHPTIKDIALGLDKNYPPAPIVEI